MKFKTQMSQGVLGLAVFEDVVRGFSFVQCENRATLKGRPTIVWNSVAEIATHLSGARNDI